MNIFAIIGLEAIAWIMLIIAFIFWDEPLARWENRTWRKIRRKARLVMKAILDWMEGIENRINWATRKIRREICACLLARDGVIVESVQTESRDLNATFTEVMRLLEK